MEKKKVNGPDPRRQMQTALLAIAREEGTSEATSVALKLIGDVVPSQFAPVLRRVDRTIGGDPGTSQPGRPRIDDSEALQHILEADQRGVPRAISIHHESIRIVRERGGKVLSVVRRLRGKLPNLGNNPS